MIKVLTSKQVEKVRELPIDEFYYKVFGDYDLIIDAEYIKRKGLLRKKYSWLAVVHLFNTSVFRNLYIENFNFGEAKNGASTLAKYGFETHYASEGDEYKQMLIVKRGSYDS